MHCTVCKGAFHPATGHWVSETRHWCGPCTLDFVAFLKQHTSRRWGGVRFYDLATVPPAEAPVGWRPEDVAEDLAVESQHELENQENE